MVLFLFTPSPSPTTPQRDVRGSYMPPEGAAAAAVASAAVAALFCHGGIEGKSPAKRGRRWSRERRSPQGAETGHVECSQRPL